MSCHGIDGCFRGDEVNIGYRPYRAIRDTAVRTGRGEAFAAVVSLRAGQGLGRQTVRNPGHLDLPPDRSPATGADGEPWIWVYARSHGGSGWIPLADAEPATSPPGRPCRGPAGFDFEPGLMPSKHGPHTTCGRRVLGSLRRRRRCVGWSAAYLRWSPDGTAWEYLHADDVVELRCHGPRDFAGVTVVSSASVATGQSGWIEERALAHTR
ncbi:MAG TPA: hypothetical protein VI318_02160 [Baekduia sp.]